MFCSICWFFLKASAPEDKRLLSNLSFLYEKYEHLDFIVVDKNPENKKPKAYKPFSITKKIILKNLIIFKGVSLFQVGVEGEEEGSMTHGFEWKEFRILQI